MSDPKNIAIWDNLNRIIGSDKACLLVEASYFPRMVNDVRQVAETSSWLPDPTKQLKLSWVDVKRKVPKFKGNAKVVDKELVATLLGSRDKKKFEEMSKVIWPPRTKQDVSQRRTRLLDWVKFARSNGLKEEMENLLYTSHEGWDIIFVTNLLVGLIVFGNDWLQRWYELGALSGDLEHFTVVAKKVSDLIKTVGIEDENWREYLECAVLSGYRNPPYPGFDPLAEAKDLAEGGVDHNLFGFQWGELVKEFLPMSYHKAEFTPFDEWVGRGKWLTTGSSSVGYLFLETADGKNIKVKCRKNMVLDVIDGQTLAVQAREFKGQKNFVIIKSELGKIRLAVTADIMNYLKMTWVVELLGGANYDWPGNTSEESFSEQTKRLGKMLSLCASKMGLPYDYKGFDHQPTTEEIVEIYRYICKHAVLNVPEHMVADYWSIAQSTIDSFSLATLGIKLDGLDEEFKVTGGLMSGLRVTSIVGNAWNSVMTGLVLKVMSGWGFDIQGIERYIRGDDSAIFVDNYPTGVAVNLTYDAIGAEAGVGKFSLLNHQMEFLRVWFSDRCYGYPVRALPGLTQRKPWASDPWSEDMVIRALYETVRTLRRRCRRRDNELAKVWRGIRHIWCVNHSLPDAVCWVPVHAGGYGIEPPPIGESWQIRPPVPKVSRSKGITIVNQNSWRADGLRNYAKEKYDIDLSDSAQIMAHDELCQTVSSDNVPDIASYLRNKWQLEVKNAKCKAFKRDVEIVSPFVPIDVNTYGPEKVDELLFILKARSPMFGSCPEVDTARADYDKFKIKMSFRDFVRYYFPRIHEKLNMFHRSWHISERLDYLSGSIKICPTVIHPALIGILARLVACSLRPSRRIARESSLWLGSAFEPAVLSSRISNFTYMW